MRKAQNHHATCTSNVLSQSYGFGSVVYSWPCTDIISVHFWLSPFVMMASFSCIVNILWNGHISKIVWTASKSKIAYLDCIGFPNGLMHS